METESQVPPTDGPKERLPGDAINVMRYGEALGWDLPVFIEKTLFSDEFFGRDARVINMYENLDMGIKKALATEAGDDPTIRFQYWRKLSEKATKLKPFDLKAELFMNPNYGIVWCLVSRGD